MMKKEAKPEYLFISTVCTVGVQNESFVIAAISVRLYAEKQ